MRIGTWNVEYASGATKNGLRLQRLREMDADVWVLTETHDDLALGPDYSAASTIQRTSSKQGARWTTIWSRYPIVEVLPVSDPHRTVAALVQTPGGPLLVYGTVLPWGTDRGPDGTAKGWTEFYRVAPLQGQEWASLQREHPGTPLCVAGDLNMNLGGPHYYGTGKGRSMLREALAGAGLVCVTEADRVPAGWLSHAVIDHVCLSASMAVRATVVSAWEGTDAAGVHLSDHSGLVVSDG